MSRIDIQPVKCTRVVSLTWGSPVLFEVPIKCVPRCSGREMRAISHVATCPNTNRAPSDFQYIRLFLSVGRTRF